HVFGGKCNWFFRALDQRQMERNIDKDPNLKIKQEDPRAVIRRKQAARERAIRGIPVFEFEITEQSLPAVMGSMLSLMADYLHESEEHIRGLRRLRLDHKRIT